MIVRGGESRWTLDFVKLEIQLIFQYRRSTIAREKQIRIISHLHSFKKKDYHISCVLGIISPLLN